MLLLIPAVPCMRSFMSGLRPDVTGIFNFDNHIREPGQPPIVTTPQQFRDWGYTTLGRIRLLNSFVRMAGCFAVH